MKRPEAKVKEGTRHSRAPGGAINFDKSGTFTSVQQGDKTYSIEDWNKSMSDKFDQQKGGE